MDSGFLSGVLALLSLPPHTAAFFRATTLLRLKASPLDPTYLCAFGPSAFAALQEGLWEVFSCRLRELWRFPTAPSPPEGKDRTFSQLSWQDMATGMEDSAEDSSSWPGGLSITSHVDTPLHHSCVSRRLESCTRAACPQRRPPFDHVLHTAREDSHQEEHQFSPSSRCQRNGSRKRTRSRSPQRRNDLHSCFVETTDCKRSTGRRRRPSPPSCHHTPGDNTAPGPSKRSSQYTPAPRAAPREQTLPMQRARSRSLWHRYDLHRQFTEYHPSAAGMRTGPPTQDRAPSDNRTQWPSHSSSHLAPAPRALLEQALLRQREWTRSLRAWLTSPQLVKNTHR